MIRFVHLSDIHLGLRSSFINDKMKREERRKDIEDSFEDTISFCIDIKNQIDGVLFTGDLFDRHNPNSRTLAFAKSQIRRLVRSNKAVFHIPGNHDSLQYGNSIYKKDDFSGIDLISSPNMTLKRSLQIKGEMINIYGMAHSYHSQAPYDEFTKEDIEGYHIALLHGSLAGHPEWKYVSKEVPLDLEKLYETGFDYIALGHFHSFTHHERNGVNIVYPGSLEFTRFGETGQRAVTVVEFDKGKTKVTRELHGINRKECIEVTLDIEESGLDSSTNVINYIREKYADMSTLLNITLTGTIPFIIMPSQLNTELKNYFFYIKIIDRTTVYNENLLSSLRNEKTIRGIFVRKLEQKMEQAESKDEREVIEQAFKLGLMRFVSLDRMN